MPVKSAADLADGSSGYTDFCNFDKLYCGIAAESGNTAFLRFAGVAVVLKRTVEYRKLK